MLCHRPSKMDVPGLWLLWCVVIQVARFSLLTPNLRHCPRNRLQPHQRQNAWRSTTPTAKRRFRINYGTNHFQQLRITSILFLAPNHQPQICLFRKNIPFRLRRTDVTRKGLLLHSNCSCKPSAQLQGQSSNAMKCSLHLIKTFNLPYWNSPCFSLRTDEPSSKLLTCHAAIN